MRVSPLLVVFICLSLLNPCPAQDPGLVYRATTRLVEVSLIALDRKGNPVTDLTIDEVSLFDKGKPRPVAFFRFEGPRETAAAASPQPLPPGIFTNRSEQTPGPPRNITALVIDSFNTDPKDVMWVRAQVTRYLRALAPETRIAVFHLGNRLTILHDFTDDADSLRARVLKAGLDLPTQVPGDLNQTIRDAEQLLQMFGDDPVWLDILTRMVETEMQYNASVRQRKVETTLAALESLGHHLSGIPGRKNLVWISGGISILSITGAMGFGPRAEIKNFEGPIRRTSERLAQQGVALYIVDARGLVSVPEMSSEISRTLPIRGRGRFERQQQAEEISSDPRPAMSTMADITGGRVLTNTNDMAAGLAAATADVRGAYTLSFYAGDEPDGKWHNLQVKVKRSGVRLLHRQGYIAEIVSPQPVAWTGDEWRAAVHNPLGSSALHIDARCESLSGSDLGKLRLVVAVEPRDLHFRKVDDRMQAEVDIAVVDKDATGAIALHKEIGTLKLATKPGAPVDRDAFLYRRLWQPAEGATAVRVLVRDRYTGRYGALDLPVKKIPVAADAAPAAAR